MHGQGLPRVTDREESTTTADLPQSLGATETQQQRDGLPALSKPFLLGSGQARDNLWCGVV